MALMTVEYLARVYIRVEANDVESAKAAAEAGDGDWSYEDVDMDSFPVAVYDAEGNRLDWLDNEAES